MGKYYYLKKKQQKEHLEQHQEKKMEEKWANYQDWYNKKIEKGVNMSPQARMYAESYDRFKMRYQNIVDEKSKKNRAGTVLDTIKERSYKGGTRTQIEMYYDSVIDGMKQLKNSKKQSDKDLYKQLTDSYGFKLEDVDINEIIKQQHGGNGDWLNPSYREDNNEEMGTLQMMYYDLKNHGIKINFSSPD